MKRMILNIMATTGITLVLLALVALCYNATVIFISAIFQALFLNVMIYVGIYVLDCLEYRYPILETGIKLVYVLSLVLLCGNMFSWYENLSPLVLGGMTFAIFGICVGLDVIKLNDEVNEINHLLDEILE